MKEMFGIAVPEHMQDLPTWEEWVIPYTTQVNDGKPDFRCMDERKRSHCVIHEKCGQCGKPLDNILAFIGGELCAQNKLFTDPAMHEQCARFAAKVCPFLNGNKREYNLSDPRSAKNPEVVGMNVWEQKRPKRMMIYFSRSYEVVPVKATKGQGTTWLIQAGKKAKKTDWTAMPASKE